MLPYQVIQEDCLKWLREQTTPSFHLSFVDPPFNQGKEYRHTTDSLSDQHYWTWIKDILLQIHRLTEIGGAVYFMQREKNTEFVLSTLREAGWDFQNLIIWKKKTSAVPGSYRFGKQYQIIAFATKGKKPRAFHRLRIAPPLPPEYKYDRENGMYVTDVWDDIRELTSGYYAGDEAIRNAEGERFHKQQAPVSLLLRIILSSTHPSDLVFDPFAGTGTTLVTALQLNRKSIGVEIDPINENCIRERLASIRKADNIAKYYKDYIHTENLEKIWQSESFQNTERSSDQKEQLSLFSS